MMEAELWIPSASFSLCIVSVGGGGEVVMRLEPEARRRRSIERNAPEARRRRRAVGGAP